jgi:DNA-binding GntR family transcriptional regulator
MPLLGRFLSQLRAFVRLVRHQALADPVRFAEVVAEHAQILEALEAQDEKAAVEALRVHLHLTADSVSIVEEELSTQEVSEKRQAV